MARQYVFFDMDGTLIDSVYEWVNLKYIICDGYFKRTGQKIELTEADAKHLETLSLIGAIRFINKKYNAKINFKREAITLLTKFYTCDVVEIDGVRTLLEKLKNDGVKLAVITATPKKLAKIALNTVGFSKYFDFILTPEFIKGGKTRRLIFIISALMRFTSPKNCVLVDDANYAHKAAKRTGFKTIGIYDKWRNDSLDACDEKFLNYNDMLEYYNKNGKL